MGRRELNHQNEPHVKRRKTNVICGNATIEKPPNVYDDFGVLTTNFNTKYVEEDQRSTEQSDYHEREVATLVSDQKHIDELPVELLIDAFDYLSLEDLCAIRQTSKRWRQIAGYCFQNNYSTMIARFISITKVHAFTQFIRRFFICGPDELQNFLNRNPKFQQLKSIIFCLIDLTGVRFDCVKEALNNVEHLETTCCKMDEHFADHILALTTNINRLTLNQHEIGNEWYGRKYPALKSVAFITRNTVPVAKFLENNPNIRELGINYLCLWANRHSMRTVNVTLDVLYVYVEHGVESSSICLLLNELHEHGVYKRLELYRRGGSRLITNSDLASLKIIFKLYMNFPICAGNEYSKEHDPYLDEPVELTSLKSLREFYIQTTSSIKDIEAAATNLQNLERIHAEYANFGHIVSFIKKSTKLKEIIIESFDNAGYFQDLDEYVDHFGFRKNAEEEPKFIDLFRLNRERANLPNARKITLYVNETLYLATIWTLGETDLQFIRLKRKESFEMYFGLFNEQTSSF